jgi:hypothetical protein
VLEKVYCIEKPDRNPASFKIQYPMKNRCKYALNLLKKKLFGCLFAQNRKAASKLEAAFPLSVT